MVKLMKLSKTERNVLTRAKKLGGTTIKVSRSGHFGVMIGKIKGSKSSKPILLNIQDPGISRVIMARKKLSQKRFR